MSRPGWSLLLASSYNVKIWMGIVSGLYLLCQDLDGHCFWPRLIMLRSGQALLLTSSYNVKIVMGIVSDLYL